MFEQNEEEKWLQAGTLLDGRYKIIDPIKAGGMGAVYKVEDLKMEGRIMALKQMLDSFTDPAKRRESIDRFLSEVQVLSTLRHPNIPQVTDHFIQEQSFFFVMEYIEGRDISQILKTEGQPGLDEQRVAVIAAEVCDALKYIHTLDVPFAHRDIKPSNLLQRESDKRIFVIDFGIARVTNPQEGFWIGTPGYAPPEQQYGKPEPRSDLYALGASMHEMLTGIRPTGFEFPSFAEMGLKVSPKIESLLVEALAWNPDERIKSARAFKKKLSDFLGYSPDQSCRSDEFVFSESVQKYKTDFLDIMLKDLIDRYINESHTRFIPKNLDYFVITLSCPMPYELIIKKNDCDKKIEFFSKEGILSPQIIDTIDPQKDGKEKAESVINSFIDRYENFKSGSWGMT